MNAFSEVAFFALFVSPIYVSVFVSMTGQLSLVFLAWNGCCLGVVVWIFYFRRPLLNIVLMGREDGGSFFLQQCYAVGQERGFRL